MLHLTGNIHSTHGKTIIQKSVDVAVFLEHVDAAYFSDESERTRMKAEAKNVACLVSSSVTEMVWSP